MTTTTNITEAQHRALRPSNRTVLDLAVAGGCTPSKTRGEFVIMRAPDGQRISLRAAHCHKGNSAQTIKQLERACGGYDAFWAPYLTTLHGPGDQTVAEPTPTVEPSQEPTPNMTTSPAPIVEPTRPRRDTPVMKRPRKPPTTGASNTVLQTLIDKGTLSVDRLADITGLPRTAVANACSYLTRQQLLERVKFGVYRVPAADVPADHKLAIEVAPAPAPVPASVAPVVNLRGPEPRIDAAPGPEAPSAPADHDQTIETLLDVIFPDGMRITGRQLQAIDQWRTATVRLLDELGA